MCFAPCTGNEKREDKCSICMNFDLFGISFDLAPTDSFIRSSTTVGAIKFISGVNVDGEIRAVPL